MHKHVTPRGVFGRLDDGGRHEERRIYRRAGDLFDPLGQALKDHRRQGRGGVGHLVHTDDKGAGVDGELREVASELLVRGASGLELPLEV